MLFVSPVHSLLTLVNSEVSESYYRTASTGSRGIILYIYTSMPISLHPWPLPPLSAIAVLAFQLAQQGHLSVQVLGTTYFVASLEHLPRSLSSVEFSHSVVSDSL